MQVGPLPVTALAVGLVGCSTILGGLDEGTARDGGPKDVAPTETAAPPRCPPGWLDGYAHRVSFDVDSTAQTPLEEHSLVLGLETKSLIAQNKLRPDGADVRVTTEASAEVIPHWVEAGLGGDATTLWTKTRLLPGRNRLFLYYGRADAEQTSSVRDVFLDGILANPRFGEGTSPWIAYPPTNGGASTLTITDGRAIVALDRTGGSVESLLGFCQYIVFPEGRSYRLLFDARVIACQRAELAVWQGGVGGQRLLALSNAGVYRPIETAAIGVGPTLLCFGGRVEGGAPSYVQAIHAEVTNLRVRSFASTDPIASAPSAEESCAKR